MAFVTFPPLVTMATAKTRKLVRVESTWFLGNTTKSSVITALFCSFSADTFRLAIWMSGVMYYSPMAQG